MIQFHGIFYLNFAQMFEKIVDLFGMRWHQSVSVRIVCIGSNDLVLNAFLLMTHDGDDFLVEIWEKSQVFRVNFCQRMKND